VLEEWRGVVSGSILTGPVMTFFDFVVHVPTSFGSNWAWTREAKPREAAIRFCIEVIILAYRDRMGAEQQKQWWRVVNSDDAVLF